MNTKDTLWALQIGQHWAEQAAKAYEALAKHADEYGMNGTAETQRQMARDAKAAAAIIKTLAPSK